MTDVGRRDWLDNELCDLISCNVLNCLKNSFAVIVTVCLIRKAVSSPVSKD